jgi:hypothetical protein
MSRKTDKAATHKKDDDVLTGAPNEDVDLDMQALQPRETTPVVVIDNEQEPYDIKYVVVVDLLRSEFSLVSINLSR